MLITRETRTNSHMVFNNSKNAKVKNKEEEQGKTVVLFF